MVPTPTPTQQIYCIAKQNEYKLHFIVYVQRSVQRCVHILKLSTAFFTHASLVAIEIFCVTPNEGCDHFDVGWNVINPSVWANLLDEFLSGIKRTIFLAF